MFLHVCQWLQDNSAIAFLNGTSWAAAILEVIHYFSMFILVGSMAIVDLRVLGLVARRHDVAALAVRLFPWIWISLAFNFLSGFLMFAGSATSYYRNDIFYDKVGVVLLAIIASIALQQTAPQWNRMPRAPVWAKLLAVISIGLWIGAIVAGVEVPALTNVG